MKRIFVASIALFAAFSLTGCASQEQVDCEDSGGVWTAHYEYTYYVLSGKALVPIAVYSYTCETPE